MNSTDVTFLSEEQARKAAISLAAKCIKMECAVAWAGENAVVTAMLSQKTKLSRVVIGTHMYQTDPAVLRKFIAVKRAKVMPPSGRLFHPKVYLFFGTDWARAIVGSHNLTEGAFGGHNVEASILISGRETDAVFVALRDFVATSWRRAESIDEIKFLFAYEVQYLANKAKRAALAKFSRNLRPPLSSEATSPVTLTWPEFVRGVRNDKYHSPSQRLAVLRATAQLFKAKRSLADMSELERKAIGGTYSDGEKVVLHKDVQWGWFGTMAGSGSFKSLIRQGSPKLSSALDCIPRSGDVTEKQFAAFVKLYTAAFKKEERQGKAAPASRLLAMKRPDVFLCINGANRAAYAEAAGYAASKLDDLANYWDAVVLPIRNAPFWQHARPMDKQQAEMWDGRAALLDSIYFRAPEG